MKSMFSAKVRVTHVGTLLLVAVLAVTIGIRMHALMLDDAYITYSSARNLARFGKLVHSLGSNLLSTTAPFYAILLSGIHALGLDVPSVSNILGATSILGSSALLYGVCVKHGYRWTGASAAFLLVMTPLLWLTLGLETCFFVCLVCAAFYLYDKERYVATAALLALAVATRSDGLIPAGIISGHHLFIARRRIPWLAVLTFIITLAPLLIYLQLSFGSPIPITLAAKRAQAQLGLTGFHVNTSLLGGLGIMLREWAAQSPLYYLSLPLAFLGIAALPRIRWAWGIVAWGGLHLAGYILLNVAPYFWYYAPVVPALVLLIGLGLQWVAFRVRPRWLGVSVSAVMLVSLLVAQGISVSRVIAALDGPLPLPSEPSSKTLPGTNDRIYREVGLWLQENTPIDATVGMTEIGIMGYFADRPVVDFLGLLQPDVAEALRRGDLYYVIPHYMPDYLVLGRDMGTFGLRFDRDDWFLSNYAPVRLFADGRFWGGGLMVLQRKFPPAPEIERQGLVEFTDGLVLDRYAIEEDNVRPGAGFRIRLDWLKRNATHHKLLTQAYLDAPDGRMVIWADREADTANWPTGRAFSTYYPIYADPKLSPGEYELGIRMEIDGQTNIYRKLGAVRVKEPR